MDTSVPFRSPLFSDIFRFSSTSPRAPLPIEAATQQPIRLRIITRLQSPLLESSVKRIRTIKTLRTSLAITVLCPP